jgi:hypothetical protein
MDRGPDRGCGPDRSLNFSVFSGCGQVQLRSFSSLATGPSNTSRRCQRSCRVPFYQVSGLVKQRGREMFQDSLLFCYDFGYLCVQ